MEVKVNIQPGKKVYCTVEADVNRSKVVIQASMTGNFHFNTGKVYYEVQDENSFTFYRVCEDDILKEGSDELKRIDDFFNGFAELDENEISILRRVIIGEINKLRQEKKKVSEFQKEYESGN
jgi:hypothetical protein